MKKTLCFALVLTAIFGFQSCVKDPGVTEEPTNARTWIIIGLGKRFNSCQDARSICIRVEDIKEKEAPNYPLELDEALSEPKALTDGAIQLEMEADVEDLSANARSTFLDEKMVIVDEDFVLSETTMRQAYENAGLPYNGQRTEVLKGAYPVRPLGGAGTAPQRIKITITIKDGKLTITISW